jgi:hypothetical protein
MSGLLFLGEVAIFVTIAYWAYRYDAAGFGGGDRGPLAMVDVTSPDKEGRRRHTRLWLKNTPSQAVTIVETVASAQPDPSGPAPQWKRSPRHESRR